MKIKKYYKIQIIDLSISYYNAQKNSQSDFYLKPRVFLCPNILFQSNYSEASIKKLYAQC